MPGPNILPLDSLVSDPRPAVEPADAIFGLDVTTGELLLIYGRPVLEEIVRAGRGKGLALLFVRLDMASGDLERLVALVRDVKGFDDCGAAWQ